MAHLLDSNSGKKISKFIPKPFSDEEKRVKPIPTNIISFEKPQKNTDFTA